MEALDDAISGESTTEVVWRQLEDRPSAWIYLLKFLWPGGFLWALQERIGGTGTIVEVTDQPGVQEDDAGDGLSGTIIRPNGLDVLGEDPNPGIGPLRIRDWNVEELTATDGRRYDFLIDRTTQAWWTPRMEDGGFTGRWGPRVTNDPNARRAGMKCPDFLALFLEAIAVHFNK